MTYRLECC